MLDFSYINEQLCVSDINISDFIKNHIPPYYIYNTRYIKKQYNIIKNNSDNLICYAVKANFNSNIIKLIVSLGGGFDCISSGEIEHVLKYGADNNKIVFSGVGKTKNEIRYAILKNIKQINCESEEELHDIINISYKLKKVANVCFRVNLDVLSGTHKYISTGSKIDKFGIDKNKILYLCKQVKDNSFINFVGFSIHIGSQITDSIYFEKAFEEFVIIINSIQKHGIKIKNIGLGGGIGIAYHQQDNEKISNMIQRYLFLVDKFKNDVKNVNIILEPGRFLVGNSCVTIANVVRIKKIEHINFAILDVGMNNIIRPALYGAYHHILPINQKKNLNFINYKIVGPICESSDIFHENYNIKELFADDIVAICSTGAYCRSMASQYNLMPILDEFFI